MCGRLFESDSLTDEVFFFINIMSSLWYYTVGRVFWIALHQNNKNHTNKKFISMHAFSQQQKMVIKTCNNVFFLFSCLHLYIVVCDYFFLYEMDAPWNSKRMYFFFSNTKINNNQRTKLHVVCSMNYLLWSIKQMFWYFLWTKCDNHIQNNPHNKL